MNDLDLYNACMRFCKAFGNAIAHEYQLKSARLCFDEIEIERLQYEVEAEEKWIQNEYNNLCEVIDKLRELRE